MDLNQGAGQQTKSSLVSSEDSSQSGINISESDLELSSSQPSVSNSQESKSARVVEDKAECNCLPLIYPKIHRLNMRALKIVKDQSLKCRQWKIFQQVLLDRTIWWHLRCNRIATSSRTTERMLGAARRKIATMERKVADGKVTEKRLGVFQKYYRQQQEQIAELESKLEQQPVKQQQDADTHVDTILPKEQHILQWELNLAQAENQRYKDENQRLMGEFDAKDKIIKQI